MSKADLRIHHLNLRKNISEAKRQYAASLIFHKLIPLLKHVNVVGTYISTKYEVDTHQLIEWCLREGKRVAVPKVTKQGLIFVEIQSLRETRRGTMDILEPVSNQAIDVPIDVMIVPMLAYNHQAYRLGYGAGYYDRTLKDYQGISIGLCFSFNEEPQLLDEAHDVPCDVILTNQTTLERKLGIIDSLEV